MAEPIPLALYAAAVASAMVANGSAVLVSKGRPLDGGARFLDGRPVLGSGKTVEGLATGTAFGLSVGYAVALTSGHGGVAGLVVALVAALAALAGDIVASFAKRRLGLERGYPLQLVDQLDFMASLHAVLLACGYAVDPIAAAMVFALTYLLHRATNVAAYRLGLKDKPW